MWKRARLRQDWSGFMGLRGIIAYRKSVVGCSFDDTYWVTDGYILIQITQECAGRNLSKMAYQLKDPIDQKRMNKRARMLHRTII